MDRFIEGEVRGQKSLLPSSLEDFVEVDNRIRVVDAFIDEMDHGAIGFTGITPVATGRPSYPPSTLLKLYLYGYLSRVGVKPFVPKPRTSHARAEGRFDKEDSVYLPDNARTAVSLHERPRRTTRAHPLSNKCGSCAVEARCTMGKERCVQRWEHEHFVDATRDRLEALPRPTLTRPHKPNLPNGLGIRK
jgi:hypothetical protein